MSAASDTGTILPTLGRVVLYTSKIDNGPGNEVTSPAQVILTLADVKPDVLERWGPEPTDVGPSPVDGRTHQTAPRPEGFEIPASELHVSLLVHGTEHILLGLIAEGESLAAQALVAVGVQQVPLRVAVAARFGQFPPPSGHIPFTPRAKKVLEYSLRESLQLGVPYVAPEHMLLGLLRAGDGGASTILVEAGVDLGALRRDLVYAATTHADQQPERMAVPPPPPPPRPNRPSVVERSKPPLEEREDRHGPSPLEAEVARFVETFEREEPGRVDDSRQLVAFVYLLARDHVRLDVVEDILRTLNHPPYQFMNGWLATWAQDVAQRLTNSPEVP